MVVEDKNWDLRNNFRDVNQRFKVVFLSILKQLKEKGLKILVKRIEKEIGFFFFGGFKRKGIKRIVVIFWL